MICQALIFFRSIRHKPKSKWQSLNSIWQTWDRLLARSKINFTGGNSVTGGKFNCRKFHHEKLNYTWKVFCENKFSNLQIFQSSVIFEISLEIMIKMGFMKCSKNQILNFFQVKTVFSFNSNSKKCKRYLFQINSAQARVKMASFKFNLAKMKPTLTKWKINLPTFERKMRSNVQLQFRKLNLNGKIKYSNIQF